MSWLNCPRCEYQAVDSGVLACHMLEAHGLAKNAEKTLRDEFAMAAMTAIAPIIESKYFQWEEMASKAYAYADAMLAARGSK